MKSKKQLKTIKEFINAYDYSRSGRKRPVNWRLWGGGYDHLASLVLRSATLAFVVLIWMRIGSILTLLS